MGRDVTCTVSATLKSNHAPRQLFQKYCKYYDDYERKCISVRSSAHLLLMTSHTYTHINKTSLSILMINSEVVVAVDCHM